MEESQDYKDSSKILSFCDSLHDFEGGRCMHPNLTPTLIKDALVKLEGQMPGVFVPAIKPDGSKGRVSSVEHKCVEYLSSKYDYINDEEIVIDLQPINFSQALGLSYGQNIAFIIDCGFRSRFGDLLSYYDGNELKHQQPQDAVHYFNLNTITSYWDEATKVSKCGFHVDIIPFNDDIKKIDIPDCGFHVDLMSVPPENSNPSKDPKKTINTLVYTTPPPLVQQPIPAAVAAPAVTQEFESYDLEGNVFDFSVRNLCPWVKKDLKCIKTITKSDKYSNFLTSKINDTSFPLHIKRSMDASLVMTAKYLNNGQKKYKLFVKRTTGFQGKKPTHSLSLPIDYNSVIKMLRNPTETLEKQNAAHVPIAVTKMLTQQDSLIPKIDKAVLITCDNLCYLRAKLEKVPAVLFVSGMAKIYKGGDVKVEDVIADINTSDVKHLQNQINKLLAWKDEIINKLRTFTETFNKSFEHFWNHYLSFSKISDTDAWQFKSKSDIIKDQVITQSKSCIQQVESLLTFLFTVQTTEDQNEGDDLYLNKVIWSIIHKFVKIYYPILCPSVIDRILTDVLPPIIIDQTQPPDGYKPDQHNLKYFLYIRNVIKILSSINLTDNNIQTPYTESTLKKLNPSNTIIVYKNDALNKILSIFNIAIDDIFRIIPNIVETDIDDSIKPNLTRSTMKHVGEVLYDVSLCTSFGGTRQAGLRQNNVTYLLEVFDTQRDKIDKLLEHLNNILPQQPQNNQAEPPPQQPQSNQAEAPSFSSSPSPTNSPQKKIPRTDGGPCSSTHQQPQNADPFPLKPEYTTINHSSTNFFHLKSGAYEGSKQLYNMLCELDTTWILKTLVQQGGMDTDTDTDGEGEAGPSGTTPPRGFVPQLQQGVTPPPRIQGAPGEPGSQLPIRNIPNTIQPTLPASLGPFSLSQVATTGSPNQPPPQLPLPQSDLDIFNNYYINLYQNNNLYRDIREIINMIKNNFIENLFNSTISTDMNVLIQLFSQDNIYNENGTYNDTFNTFKSLFNIITVNTKLNGYFGPLPNPPNPPTPEIQEERFNYAMESLYENSILRAILVSAFIDANQGQQPGPSTTGGGIKQYSLKDYHRKYYRQYYELYYNNKMYKCLQSIGD